MLLFDIIAVLIFVISLYLFIKNPIYTKYDTEPWVDPLVGFILTFIVVTYMYVAHYVLALTPETATSPCGQLSSQIECYNVSQANCMIAWNSSRGSCDARLEEIRKERPSALTGVFLETCISRNFDKVMRYNRQNTDKSTCQDYFRRISN